MNKWLKNFFQYLDRYYVKYHSLPTLEAAGVRSLPSTIYIVICGCQTVYAVAHTASLLFLSHPFILSRILFSHYTAIFVVLGTLPINSISIGTPPTSPYSLKMYFFIYRALPRTLLLYLNHLFSPLILPPSPRSSSTSRS